MGALSPMGRRRRPLVLLLLCAALTAVGRCSLGCQRAFVGNAHWTGVRDHRVCLAAKRKIKIKTTTRKVPGAGVLTSEDIEERNRIVKQVEERNAKAWRDGAFMDTIYGQIVLLVTGGGAVLLILYDLYFNIFVKPGIPKPPAPPPMP